MKIVVLGATGFIGAALARQLREKGIDRIAIGCSSKGPRLDEKSAWLDVALEGADVVYQCAGRTGGVGRMANDPLSFVYPNVKIHMSVFEACAKAGVKRVVCLNSTTGYPDSSTPMDEDQYLEGEPHKAYFGPGNAHRFIYRLAQMFPFETVLFRPSNVYGPGNNFDAKTSHVIEATVRKVVEQQDPFVIWGNGMDVRDAIYIDDLVELMTFGIDCPAGAYNVGTGSEMTVNEMVKVLLDHADFHPTIEHDLSKPSAIPARRVSIDKALALGWTPKVSMPDGLRTTLNWYQAECVFQTTA
jgi:GDP-L-fucose synthase